MERLTHAGHTKGILREKITTSVGKFTDNRLECECEYE